MDLGAVCLAIVGWIVAILIVAKFSGPAAFIMTALLVTIAWIAVRGSR